MLSILLNSLVLLGSVTLMSYMNSFFEKYSYNEAKKIPLYLMGGIVFFESLFCVAAALSFNESAIYVFYTLDRFLRVLFIAEAIILMKDYSALSEKHISGFISYFAYSSFGLYFVDTIINRGKLANSFGSVYLVSDNSWLCGFHFLIYLSYILCFLVAILYKRISIRVLRDKPEHIFYSLSLFCCIISFVINLLVINGVPIFFIPYTLFDFAALEFMFRLVRYHRSIVTYEEDYSNELSEDKTDIVFILNDEHRILYQSKRAEALATILEDTYIGRDFFDVFELPEEEKMAILTASEKDQIGTGAEYKKLSKHVNLLVQNKTDFYGSVLSSCVKVYNMEPKEMRDEEDEQVQVFSDNMEKLLDDAADITNGTKALVISEGSDFSKELVDALKAYSIDTTLSDDCDKAKEDVLAGSFDISFWCDNLPDRKAFETVKEIRSISGDEIKNMPLILVSSTDINNIFMDMLEAEFTDYIYNPLDKIQLDSCLKRWLRED